MFSWWLGREAIRRRQLQRCTAAELRAYLSVSGPAENTRIADLKLLALDFETTGPDARTNKILSVGWVEVDALDIELNSQYHQIIAVDDPLQESNVLVHQITDDHKASGAALEEVLPSLLQKLAGRVLLAHHAKTEIAFLHQACERLYGQKPVLWVVDTMQMANRRLLRLHRPPKPRQLRLYNLRRSHGLPNYKAHNALSDALMTAELFLVETAKLRREDKTHLKRILY